MADKRRSKANIKFSTIFGKSGDFYGRSVGFGATHGIGGSGSSGSSGSIEQIWQIKPIRIAKANSVYRENSRTNPLIRNPLADVKPPTGAGHSLESNSAHVQLFVQRFK